MQSRATVTLLHTRYEHLASPRAAIVGVAAILARARRGFSFAPFLALLARVGVARKKGRVEVGDAPGGRER